MVHHLPFGGGGCRVEGTVRGMPSVCPIVPLVDVAGPAGKISQIAQPLRRLGHIRLAVVMPWPVSFAV